MKPPGRGANRRQFLTGRAISPALDDLVDRLTPRVGQDESPPREGDRPCDYVADPYHVRLARPAMACQFEVVLNAGQHAGAVETALAAFDLIEQLEAQMTVYRDSSEVAYLNRWAHHRAVPVDPRLFSLFTRAVELWRDTGGAFDITAGPLVKVWGFHRRAGAIPSQDALARALNVVGGQWLELDAESTTVRFAREGVDLNLGAIGKGHALDRAAERMADDGVADFLWHGGQSSVLARGAAAAESSGGWLVGLRHPLKPERRIAEIRLLDQALGTSGTAQQFFRHEGKRYGHILDPRSGWPAEGMFTSTAVCASAAEADALATAFYVMGPRATLEYCEKRRDVGAVLLYPSANGSSVELKVANIPEDRFRLLCDP